VGFGLVFFIFWSCGAPIAASVWLILGVRFGEILRPQRDAEHALQFAVGDEPATEARDDVDLSRVNPGSDRRCRDSGHCGDLLDSVGDPDRSAVGIFFVSFGHGPESFVEFDELSGRWRPLQPARFERVTYFITTLRKAPETALSDQ